MPDNDFFNLKDKIKRYFTFEQDEIRGMLYTIIFVAFVLSFKDWGVGKTFILSLGLRNFFNAFLVSGLAIIVHESAHKIYALRHGFKTQYKMWLYGMIFGLMLCFATNGVLFFLAVGSITYSMMQGHRLGYYYYGLNYYELAKISVMGPVANVLLALFFKAFSFTGNTLILKAMYINIWIAIFALLPLPGMDGLNIFYGSRTLYALGVGFVLGIALLIFKASIIATIAYGLIVSIAAFTVYLFGFEISSLSWKKE